MIRERVAADGTCRPLEPVSELAAMQVPEDEICVIKEGPAMRYLNGQALWDKKFSHAIKKIQKQRRKNLREAKEKDQKKIVKMWKDRVKQHREEEEMERMDTHGYGAQDEGWDTDSDEGPSEAAGTSGDATAKKGRKPRERLKDKTGIDLPEEMLDQSWSWSWALQGEAPPPSAIVSRRDFVSLSLLHPHISLAVSVADPCRRGKHAAWRSWQTGWTRLTTAPCTGCQSGSV